MKKYFLLSLFLVAGLMCTNAQMAYLLTEASIAALPAENFNGVDQKPEQNAANWFQTTYVTPNKGKFVSIADLKAGLSTDVKVLWINIDRVGLPDLATAGLDVDAVAAVKSFVEKGGCLLLTKQAAHLSYQIGRIGYEPTWNSGGYNVGGDIWKIKAQLGTDPNITTIDRSGHPIYNNLTTDADLLYPMVGAVARTDNNIYWGDLMRKDPNTGGPMAETDETKAQGITHYQNNNPLRLTDFESDWAASMLATWPHIQDFCIAQILELKAQNNFKGSITNIGFAAYQWGTANDYIANVQKITENSLAYLLTQSTTTEVENVVVTPNDGRIFNILGQPVDAENAHNGIFIINGQKVFIK